jgi:multidrug resistance efflux pump
MHKNNLIPLTVLLLASFLLAACQPGNSSGSAVGTPTALPPSQANASIVVDGKLVPRESVSLAFDTSGQVVEVLVEEGDLVKAGDVLARLGNREQYESNLANARLEQASAELELLNAQQALDQLSKDLPERQTAALQALTEARDAYREAERQYNNMDSPAKEQDVNEARANLILAKDKLEKAREDYAPYENKNDDNLTKASYLSALAAAQRAYDASVRQWNNLTGGPGEFNRSQIEAEYNIAQARLDQAQADYDLLANGPDPDEVAQAQSRIDTAEERITAAKAAIQAAEAALSDLELVATIDGTLVQLDLIEGQRVTPGQDVAQLADFSQWYVETDNLTEIEVVDIANGDQATITPDALDLVMTGVVESISDLYEDKLGDITYTARLRVDEVDPRLRWGMTVSVVFE